LCGDGNRGPGLVQASEQRLPDEGLAAYHAGAAHDDDAILMVEIVWKSNDLRFRGLLRIVLVSA